MSTRKPINRRFLIAPKLLYINMGLLIFALHTFRQIFIREYIGFDDAQYSRLMGVVSIISFFTNIGLGYFADRLNNPKLLLLSLIAIISAVFYTFMFFKDRWNMFYLLYFVYFSLCQTLLPLLDRYMLEMLPSLGASMESYGAQRLFGTFAFPLATIIIENLIRNESEPTNQAFKNLNWYQLVLAVSCSVLVFICVRGRSAEETKMTDATPTKNNTNQENSINNHNIMDLFRNPGYIFFIFIVLLNGMPRATMTLYLSGYSKGYLKFDKMPSLENTPKFNAYLLTFLHKSPLGICNTAGTSLEIVVMLFTGIISSKMGLYWPLLFAQLAQLIRITGYYFLKPSNKYRVLICCLLETLKGVNFALTHVSSVKLAVNLCPAGLKSTSTMIYNGAFVPLSIFLMTGLFSQFFKESDPELEKECDYRSFLLFNMIICVAGMCAFMLKYFHDVRMRHRMRV